MSGLHNRFFYGFFCYLEPLLTFIAATYIFYDTDRHILLSLPAALGRVSNISLAHTAAVHLLANCYGLLGLLGFFLLPAINNAPIAMPVKMSLLYRYFAVLAFADLTHIGLSLYDLQHIAFRPLEWNLLAYGNIVITIGLFVTRVAWYRQSRRLKY